MPKISNINEFISGASPDIKEVLRGYQSLWQGLVEDSAGDPVDLSSQTITASAEFYTASVSSGAISSLEKVSGKSKRDLTVTIDADQTSNPGKFTMLIPADLWSDEIDIDVDILPLAVIFMKRTAGQEVRISRTLIAFRRGEATDG